MKKILLITLAVFSLQIAANASVSVDEVTSREHLLNSGYSGSTADMVKITSARALGQEAYTDREQKCNDRNKFVDFWRKLYVYFDPATEDYSIYHHDSKPAPSYTDL